MSSSKSTGYIQMFFRDAAAGRAAGLHGLELLAAGNAVADLVDDVPERHAHRHFDQAGIFDLADQGKDLGALASGGSELIEPVGAVVDDQRHIGPGFDVVDVGRLAPKPAGRRIGRPRSRLARLALQRQEQSRFLTADESAGSPVHFDV